MNIKRTFGAVLTVLGIVALIYGAFVFVNTSGGARNIKTLATCLILGLIFFASGISLVKTTRDE